MKIEVVLTPDEWAAAESIGRRRQQLRVDRGVSSAEYNDKGGTLMDRNAIGSVAEYALAKALGPDVLRDWCENKAFSLNHRTIPCDVGKNLHVRATSNSRARFLVLHPYDPDSGVFILARVNVETHTVVFAGWVVAGDYKYPEYWNDYGVGFREPGRAAYTIDSSGLNDMAELPADSIR